MVGTSTLYRTSNVEPWILVLLSLIQFYGDQRGKYASPTELEMRVYHRLIHIRDQRTRNEEVPEEIENHPVFKLTTQFRRHVQDKSVPITKTSKLVVDAEAMEIFGRLASVLREQNNVIMIYLVACIMERLFGDDTIEDIESIRGGLEIPQIIDGIAMPTTITSPPNNSPTAIEQRTEAESVQAPLSRSATEWLTNNFGAQPPVSTFGVPSSATPQPTLPLPTNPPIVKSAFSNLTTTPSAFGSSNVFGGPVFGQNVKSVFNTSVSTQKPSLAGPSSVPSQPSTSITTSSNLIVAPSVFSSSPLNNLSPSLSQASPPNQKVPAMSSRSSQSSVQPIAIPTHLNPQATEFIPQDLPLPPTPLRPVQAVQPSIPISNGQLRPTLKISPHSVPAEPFPCPNILQEDPGPSMDTSNLEATFTLTPFPEHPKPRIVERRQTLWEIPGTPPVTPPARTPAPALTQNEPMSPREPPPLGKVQPVSLPPTPTARWFDPSSLPKLPDSSLLRKKSLLGFPNLQFSAPTPAEILSPLQIPSPGSLRAPIFNTGSPSPATRTQAGSAAPPISPTKLPRVVEESSSHAKAETEVTPKQLRELAVSFRSGQLQKKCFSRWLEKATDRAAYAEACARSEVYRERVQHQRLSGSTGNTTPNKKRRISLGSSVSSSHGKRTRIRRSGEYRPPQTDETLVKRLKEVLFSQLRRFQGQPLIAFFFVFTRTKKKISDDGPGVHSSVRFSHGYAGHRLKRVTLRIGEYGSRRMLRMITQPFGWNRNSIFPVSGVGPPRVCSRYL